MHAFEELDMAVTIWERGHWLEIRERPDDASLMGLEMEHGTAIDRTAYNMRCLELACRRNKAVVGRHGGFSDLFVPISIGGRAESVLVTGPFATERPTSASVLDSWRALTGRQGHPADPEFSHYVAVTLSTLVLEGSSLVEYQRLVECVARLMASENPSEDLFREVEVLRDSLAATRLVDRVWRAAHAMVDGRLTRIWSSAHRETRLPVLGLSAFPEQVVVGLFVNRESERDPVEELLRRDAFQRASVELARKAGNVISGQVGDHGVTFLGASSSRGSHERLRRKLLDVAEQASLLARRRFGFALHVGVSTKTTSLLRQYDEAMAAAESALSRGVSVVTASERSLETNPLRRLRRELTMLAEERPDALPARFDRYLEAVALRSGHRLEVVRPHLEAAFERLADSIVGSGALEGRALVAFGASLERAADESATLSELFSVYRRALLDLLDSAARPRAANRDRSLRRAEEYMRQHYAEGLSLGQVAREAGYAPRYLSALFKRKHRVTFEHYLTQLRIERAKHLLSGTQLTLERVAQLSGFSGRHYFGRVFRQSTGETPHRHRLRTKTMLAAALRERDGVLRSGGAVAR
jgi:AraC-like DNA-binding protein